MSRNRLRSLLTLLQVSKPPLNDVAVCRLVRLQIADKLASRLAAESDNQMRTRLDRFPFKAAPVSAPHLLATNLV